MEKKENKSNIWMMVSIVLIVIICSVMSFCMGAGIIANAVSTQTPTKESVQLYATPDMMKTVGVMETNATMDTFIYKSTSTPLYTSTVIPSVTSMNTLVPTATEYITAICGDGVYSHSMHIQGTCSGHDGIKEWINKPSN